MLDLDIEELRRLSEKAAAENDKQRREYIQAEQRKAAAEERRRAAEAGAVLAGIPEKCHAAALKGERTAMVYRVKVSDYETYKVIAESGSGRAPRGSVAQRVFDACAKLSPKWEHGHDGMGMDEWFDLVVVW